MNTASGPQRANVFVCYHQMVVIEPGADYASTIGTNGLTAARPGAAVIMTGIHTGNVDVTVQLVASCPSDMSGEWEEVEEVELITFTGDMRLSGLMNDSPENFPSLTPQGPGRYQMRVHARGRGINYDGTAQVPFEFYLVVVWPLELGLDAVASYKQGENAPISRSDKLRAVLKECLN